jgi:hypothetical protein
MSADHDLLVIVCRSGREPLRPGSKRGYKCAVCCTCGLEYSKVAAHLDKLAGIEMNEAAREYFESERSRDNPVAQWIRKQTEGHRA